MKKRTLIAISLAILGLIALGALTVYLTLQYKDDIFSSGKSKTESDAEAVLLALHESESAGNAADSAGSIPDSAASSPIIWAGDSRTIGMRDALKNDDIYIGASGEGYDWLSSTGLPLVKEAIEENPKAPVVFNFGVNDYDNLSNYMALYGSLTKEYPDTHFYFLSVNPIEPTVCKNITNEEITDFNNHLKELFPDTYLDSFTYLMTNEVVPIDGVHYSKEDYQLIYDYAAGQISRKENP